ncbi:small GTP-binding protein [Histomonas meleagridis]|uniref:small GTP-binding protein n=1 Tax=Histomonas meleagridis TaxID=135588 RepID=UPI00355A41A0|nr:small GTP-binding protein [Histomonas meleagridis]KAH0803433.1 small GTP-binding protein [Histomonas meleagridis]
MIEQEAPVPRVILIGNSFCGKTALFEYLKGHKTVVYEQTIGPSNFEYSKNIKGKNYRVQVWDTAGQEQYRALGPIYYRNAAAGIFVYDITEADTFNSIPEWYRAFADSVGRKSFLFLVGNKLDLEEKRAVDQSTANSFAKDNGFIFFETSALEGTNVDLLFQAVFDKVHPIETVSESKEKEVEVVKDNKCKC